MYVRVEKIYFRAYIQAQASLQEHYEKSISSKEEHTTVKMQMEEQRKKVYLENIEKLFDLIN